MTDTPLCRVTDLGDPDVLTVTTTDQAGQPLDLIVARWQGLLMGFVNRCPHEGVPLTVVRGDRLMDRDLGGKYLACGKHGARFTIHSGRCAAGPSRSGLTPVALTVRDGQVFLVNRPRIPNAADPGGSPLP